ncbi:hypothetical protein GDO81_017585 [Engystomops pustulosus]|uniref:Uncharacterized protein n=1 Tax=Engystomops pustulosus TaxID=76066 RepID=A0AAV7A5F8_ENGPU|nr:hypothetical protein GDO81_017585 [Engystomops pustulosus]
MAASDRATLLVRRVRAAVRIFCRHRYKKKWATSFAAPSPPRLALQYFDVNYGAQLGSLWPSVRVGLLSEQKYGALINNFSSVEAVTRRLSDLSSTDLLQEARVGGGDTQRMDG